MATRTSIFHGVQTPESGEIAIGTSRGLNNRKLIERGDFESGAGRQQTADLVTPYVDEIAGQFHFDRGVTLVSDAGNGTAGP